MIDDFHPPFPELAPGHWSLLAWWTCAVATACTAVMAAARVL